MVHVVALRNNEDHGRNHWREIAVGAATFGSAGTFMEYTGPPIKHTKFR